MDIGKNIKELRRRKQMTQLQLAERLGITAQAVSKWENGHSAPDISLLPKLSEMFGVTIEELIK